MRSVLVLMLALVALPAAAHAEHGVASAFLDGALHPVTGLDHLAGMLAIGLWSRRQGLPASITLVFLLAMAGGAAGIGLFGWSGAGELALALSVALVGMLLASVGQVRALAAVALVATLALLHGLAHASEMPAPASMAGYLLSSALLVLAGRSFRPAGRPRLGAAARV